MVKDLINKVDFTTALRRLLISLVIGVVTALVFNGLTAHRSIEWKRYHITGSAQGTTYSIIYYGTDSVVTKAMIDLMLAELDSSLSLYKPYSRINQFNNSKNGITLDKHLQQVVKKSIAIYKETGGLFDMTVYPLVEAWGFGVKKITGIPDSALIRSLCGCVSSNLVEPEGDFLHKKKPCVKIDLNGIAQGYSVDVIAALLDQYRISNYIVELGGEIRVNGTKQPGGEKLKIGIESPAEDVFEQYPLQQVIAIDKGAITTSGSYRKFYESNGQKITHLINPKTGYPHKNELISVTVYAKDAMTADGYDNALMLMGLKEALAFIERRKDLAAYFVYNNANGSVSDTASSTFLTLMNP